MLEANQDKRTITVEATGTPVVFCFSLSPLPLLFPLLSTFYYSLSSALSSCFPWYPCLLLSSSPALPLPLFLLSFPVFCSRVEATPSLMEKKRLVCNLNNCAAQFSSSWTLWGKNGWGVTLYQDKGTRMSLSQAFVSMFFTGWNQC